MYVCVFMCVYVCGCVRVLWLSAVCNVWKQECSPVITGYVHFLSRKWYLHWKRQVGLRTPEDTPVLWSVLIVYFLPPWPTARSGPRPPHYRGSTTHTDTPQSVGMLWTSDQPDAETYTCQHTSLTRERHPCLRRNSNLQSQQAICRRPTLQTAWP